MYYLVYKKTGYVLVGDTVADPRGGHAIVREISRHPELGPTLSVCITHPMNSYSEWVNPDDYGMRWVNAAGDAVDFGKVVPPVLTEANDDPLDVEDGDAVKHMIVQGNPVDGFTYYGPFDTPEEAEDYVLKYDNGESWWHAKMTRNL